jgi:hypothetical protein
MHWFMTLAFLAASAPQAIVAKPVANMYPQPESVVRGSGRGSPSERKAR